MTKLYSRDNDKDIQDNDKDIQVTTCSGWSKEKNWRDPKKNMELIL
jgi:hypothetical protein